MRLAKGKLVYWHTARPFFARLTLAAGGAYGGKRRLRRQAALAAEGGACGARLAILTVGTSVMAAAHRQKRVERTSKLLGPRGR